MTDIPKLLRTVERDSRGYPIPFLVMRDKSGTPQFSINDGRRIAEATRKRLCSICGKKLGHDAWFIGGVRPFLHEQGAFLDPPTHHECGAYALQVCPFLATPRYAKAIEARRLRPGAIPDNMILASTPTFGGFKPERFGFGCTRSYRQFQSSHQGLLFRVDAWDYVEWWRDGERINAPDSGIADVADVEAANAAL